MERIMIPIEKKDLEKMIDLWDAYKYDLPMGRSEEMKWLWNKMDEFKKILPNYR